jgi:hypothetical protein
MLNEPAIHLGSLGLDRGGHLLLKHALRGLQPGARLEVWGSDPPLPVHLRAWCRTQGLGYVPAGPTAKGPDQTAPETATPDSTGPDPTGPNPEGRAATEPDPTGPVPRERAATGPSPTGSDPMEQVSSPGAPVNDVAATGASRLPGPASAGPGTAARPRLAGRVVASRGPGRRDAAEPAGRADPALPGAVVNMPPLRWGLAARGARVERGTPEFDFPIAEKDTVWADEAGRIYAQAVAAQWNPETAIDWNAPIEHPEDVEDAVVQIMTYLIENETAALIIPARFASRIHPHFKEVLQVLAIQAADEARHIEVFTRRARMRRSELALSTSGGQASLKTLLDESDFAVASFLLSVLGEGSFLNLLWFLHEHGPDPVTREVCRFAAQDEARHVAFGLAHLSRHVARDPTLRARLASAVHRRSDSLRHTSGLNQEVFDALVVLAAGSWDPGDIARGHECVVSLNRAMDQGRRTRLRKLGFEPGEAEALSGLHTRNFM